MPFSVPNSTTPPLSVKISAPPMIAGAAMAFSSVSVVGNALLLRRWRPDADAAAKHDRTSEPAAQPVKA